MFWGFEGKGDVLLCRLTYFWLPYLLNISDAIAWLYYGINNNIVMLLLNRNSWKLIYTRNWSRICVSMVFKGNLDKTLDWCLCKLLILMVYVKGGIMRAVPLLIILDVFHIWWQTFLFCKFHSRAVFIKWIYLQAQL